MTPRIYYSDIDNYDFNVVRPPNENAGYPLANLHNYDRDSVWKGFDTTSPQYLYFAFSSARAANFILFDNHNFATLQVTATISLEAADNSTFTSGFQIVESSLSGSSIGLTVFGSGSVSKKYWRVKFLGTLSEAPQIGQVFLDSYLAFTQAYDSPYRFGKKYETVEESVLSGRSYATQVYAGRRTQEMRFSLHDATFRSQYLTFQQAIRGRERPFYFQDIDSTVYPRVHQDSDYVPLQSRFAHVGTKEQIEKFVMRAEIV